MNTSKNQSSSRTLAASRAARRSITSTHATSRSAVSSDG